MGPNIQSSSKRWTEQDCSVHLKYVHLQDPCNQVVHVNMILGKQRSTSHNSSGYNYITSTKHTEEAARQVGLA